MFDHPHHDLILTILNSVDQEFFWHAGIYFGGGTYITFRYGEYRWSKDVDFVCPVGPGYHDLRARLFEHGHDAIFKDTSKITLLREPVADQYAVRQAVQVDGTLIKFEVVLESRIQLGEPDVFDWCPVPCLNTVDCFAEKLLANADRWSDRSIESRDLIDLAVLRYHHETPAEAIEKAESAYPVMKPLQRAIEMFQADATYRDKCFTGLQVHDRKHIIDGLDLLAADFGDYHQLGVV
jgi:hypothetical protein